ncbi:TetR family transcriptional regulator [Streptomyces longispororuber]|uniref:TetR family transcriptional regulator n=1 Tax=Streptomyces longispororuber TaxID=68230 RepID=A0A919A885_9ACTN|nr:TetR/AcrR family transcriptional regulator [Streptomyces longispororuber]GHE90386.1 TetR family transcriptional regulator [Streptomyces longispororuber]
MSPKQQRGEATADLLLDTALAVYARGGERGFTVNAVTAASGVSFGSLYHHFGSFDGLAAALYLRCVDQLCDPVVAAVTRSRTARTGIRALVRAYLDFTRDHRDVALFLHGSAYSSYLAAHAKEVMAAKDAKFAPIGDWLRPRVASGEVAALPPHLIEILVMGPVAETAHRWLSSTYEVDLDEAARVLPDRIWRALRSD